MTKTVIRLEAPSDRQEIARIVERAFAGTDEARLIEKLREAGDVVLSLVAERDGDLAGHVLFSRLTIEGADGERIAALALAPLAVRPEAQRQGVGSALVETSHRRLIAAGETLSIVLGDPDYYGRFGYSHECAAGFDSEYQGPALQALAFESAPTRGVLIYAPAFGALS